MSIRQPRAHLIACVAAVGVSACGADDTDPTGDDVADVADTAADVTLDAAVDARIDTQVDAPIDTGADTPETDGSGGTNDAVSDASDAAAADVLLDGATEVGVDAMSDVSADVPHEVASDAAPFPCEVTSTSNLTGVRLAFTNEECEFSRAQLASGVTFRWQVDVDQSVQNVRPIALDAGRCGRPDDSGLIPFFRIDGDATYCLCDEGLCFAFDETADLLAGTWTGEAMWTGRAWFGPSDTGNPLGDPFAPGEYTASVVAEGTQTTGEDGPEIPFRLTTEMAIRVVP